MRTVASVNVVPACRPLSVEYAATPDAFASVAVGVGHISRTKFGKVGPPCSGWFSAPQPFASRAVGVGHAFAAPVKIRLPRANVPLARPESAAQGVGHWATVWRAIPVNRSSADLLPPRFASPSVAHEAVGVGQRRAIVKRLGVFALGLSFSRPTP